MNRTEGGKTVSREEMREDQLEEVAGGDSLQARFQKNVWVLYRCPRCGAIEHRSKTDGQQASSLVGANCGAEMNKISG